MAYMLYIISDAAVVCRADKEIAFTDGAAVVLVYILVVISAKN